jgi:hypothetical protein
MPYLMDIWHAVQAIVLSGDWKMLAIMAVIALAAGYTMPSLGSVLSTTVIALVAFALVEYALAITIGKQSPAGYAAADWEAFKHLAMLTLLAYGVVFAVAIGIFHTAKTLILDR